MFLVFLFILNVLSARAYGESEYWFAGIKVSLVLVFLFVGVLMIAGLLGGASPGFSNWTVGEAPFVGGFSTFVSIFMIAAFAFNGTEMVGIAAGESENPERDIPKAINSVFWRILLFYISALWSLLVFCCRIQMKTFLKTDVASVAVSPFTLVFNASGLCGGCFFIEFCYSVSGAFLW